MMETSTPAAPPLLETNVVAPPLALAPPPSVVAAPPRPTFERVKVWGLALARVTYDDAVRMVDALIDRGRPSYFITANLHYAMLTARDRRLARVNRGAAFLLADGMPMVWYSRLLGRPLPQRVTGADLVYRLCQRAAECGHRIFLLGGAPGVAEQAAQRLVAMYPGLKIVGTAAPDLRTLSPEEHAALIDRVRQSQADLLLVAFGQPKGELWMQEHHAALGVPVSVQLGATLDFVAGRVRRAPRWMQRYGGEWLYRMLSEPQRLAPRYGANLLFLARALARDARRWLRRRFRRPR